MLIGLSSYIGGGKDTVTKMIQLLMLYHQPPITQKSMVKSWANSKTDIETVKEWIKPVYENRFVKLSTWENRKFAAKLKQMCSLLTGISVEDFEKQSVKDSELGPEWDTWSADKSPDRIFLTETECKEWCAWQPTIIQPLAPVLRKMTIRTLLQKLGTDAVRDKVHQNAWVNALFADYVPDEGFTYPVKHLGGDQFQVLEDPKPYSNGYPNWLISDLRFSNEFQAIKDRGGICIRINRYPDIVTHSGGNTEGHTTKFDLTSPQHIDLHKGMVSKLHSSETSLDNADFDYTINNSGTLEELLEQVRTMLLHFKIIS